MPLSSVWCHVPSHFLTSRTPRSARSRSLSLDTAQLTLRCRITFRELEYVTKELFAQRRKVVQKSLAAFIPGAAEAAAELLAVAKVDGRKRPENLEVREFCTLTRHFMDRYRSQVTLVAS